MMVFSECFFRLLISSHETFFIFSPLCSAVEGSERDCLVSGSSQGQPCTIVLIFLLGAKYLPFVSLLVSSEDSLEGCVKRTSVRSCIPTSPIACWSGSCQRAFITCQQNNGGAESWKLKDDWLADSWAPGSLAMQTHLGIWKSANELGEARATGSSVKGQWVTWTAPEPWFLVFPSPKGLLHVSGLWLHTLKVNILEIIYAGPNISYRKRKPWRFYINGDDLSSSFSIGERGKKTSQHRTKRSFR